MIKEFSEYKELINGLTFLNIIVTYGESNSRALVNWMFEYNNYPYYRLVITGQDKSKVFHHFYIEHHRNIHVRYCSDSGFVPSIQLDNIACHLRTEDSKQFLQEFIYKMEELYGDSFEDRVHSTIEHLISNPNIKASHLCKEIIINV